MDVSSWLRDLGLADYAQAFRANDIDAAVLSRLTSEDLVALGVTSVGHRRKLLDAIALLQGGPALAAADPTVTTARPVAAERRQLTVLFCDLVGSTELSARLDPEDLREIIGAYQACVTEAVQRWEGHVAKYLGDGVLAYFGWPRAHEDDAERAVRAGLALIDAVAGLETDLGARLQARAAIATGLVVIGDLIGKGTTKQHAVTGETPNLAARLQTLAEPGSVVISQATRRVLGGLFDLDDLGPHRLKGFAEPLAVWRVSRKSRVEGRFEARHRAGLTPLVGREGEIALLLRRWQQARQGEGQVVLLSGEPGIGKSRLVRELRGRLEGEPHIRLLCQCSPHHTTSPLHPVIEQLERAGGFERDDPPEARLDKLETLLARGTEKLDEAVPLIAASLGIPGGERYPPLDLTPQRQKQRTLEVLVDQVEGLADGQPVLLVYEDVHWIDPTTLELLGLAIERVQRLPVLLIVTFRPEFAPPWTGQPHLSSLSLTRLDRRYGALMLTRVVGAKALPPEVAAQIIAKTDGVPLFVEELTKAVLESGLLQDSGERYELSGPLPPLAIPSTLHDSLLARLDRLASAKEVAQIGAAIGREFSHELLAAVAPLTDNDLRHALSRLVEAELIFRRGTPPEATYSFKHMLVRDAAYETLLRSRRQQLHAQIADALRERFPETVEAEPELMARHCMEAGLTEEAIQYLAKAGRQALDRSANAEAVEHLSKGLALLETLPAGPERDLRELDLLVALGGAMVAARGYAAPETVETYTRARRLCQQMDDVLQVLPVLWGQHVFQLARGDMDEACEAAEELLGMAECQLDPALALIGHRVVGAAVFCRGEPVGARAHLEQALALYEPGRHRPLASLYGQDPRVAALSWLSWDLFCLGWAEHAAQRSREALAETRELFHPNTTAFALFFGCALAQFLGQSGEARERAETLIALASEQGFPFWLAGATVVRGWALVDQGQTDEGIAHLRRGLRSWRGTGAEFLLPYFLALLAEARQRSGHAGEALRLLAHGLRRTGAKGERWFEPELHRLRGEYLLRLSDQGASEAETCYLEAVEIARAQNAKSWELRAATSLAQLWRDQGKRAEAHDLLAPIYGWFTEGFDTADLKDAKALLNELA